MKAITYTEYGPPDVLQFTEVAKPTPKDDEVLIRILAASVNPLDWHYMRGTPYFLRTQAGLRRPKKSGDQSALMSNCRRKSDKAMS